jgi:hypothetical protein
VFLAYGGFVEEFRNKLDELKYPLLAIMFYTLVELLPAVLVLYILRKLPPKRAATYSPLPSGPAETVEYRPSR